LAIFILRGVKNLKSEFGKGLVINLVKFSEHFNYKGGYLRQIKSVLFYLEKNKEERDLMISDDPPPNLDYGKEIKEEIKMFLICYLKIWKSYEKAISQLITLWANGATDHLYEIEVPEGKEWNKIRKLVSELQNKGLDMGHGFKDKIYVYDDVLELWELVKKICILIDKKIGLKPNWGEW